MLSHLIPFEYKMPSIRAEHRDLFGPSLGSLIRMAAPPSHSHGLWDALKQTYDDTVEDDLYAQQDSQDDDRANEEDWEKGIPPFVRKLTKMVGENKSIL